MEHSDEARGRNLLRKAEESLAEPENENISSVLLKLYAKRMRIEGLRLIHKDVKERRAELVDEKLADDASELLLLSLSDEAAASTFDNVEVEEFDDLLVKDF